nr:MAG TPA: hypothetical protein [Caudoviricetes sp.]
MRNSVRDKLSEYNERKLRKLMRNCMLNQLQNWMQWEL